MIPLRNTLRYLKGKIKIVDKVDEQRTTSHIFIKIYPQLESLAPPPWLGERTREIHVTFY